MSFYNSFSGVAMWAQARIPQAASLTAVAGASTLSAIAPIASKTVIATIFVMQNASKLIPPTLSWLWWATKKAVVVGMSLAASCAVQLSFATHKVYKNGGFNQISASVQQIGEPEQKKAHLAKQVESLSAENEALKAAYNQLQLVVAQQNERISLQQGQIEQANQLVAALQAEIVEEQKKHMASEVNKINKIEELVESDELVAIEASSIPIPPPPPPMPIRREARRVEAKDSKPVVSGEEKKTVKKDVVPRPTAAQLVSGLGMLKKRPVPAFTKAKKSAEDSNEIASALKKGLLVLRASVSDDEEDDIEEHEF